MCAGGSSECGYGMGQFLHSKIVALERERQQAIRHDRGKAIDKVRRLLLPGQPDGTERGSM